MWRYRSSMLWMAVFGAIVTLGCAVAVGAVNVSYDQRAILIDGKRRFLQSGSIHYPRSTPEMWPQLINYAKQGGLDVIETYVFWNVHEPFKGTYNFEGNYDLVQFIKLVASAGLYANLRIGPYVCAEWNFGGFPSWLRFIPNMQLRTDNQPFKDEMGRFVKKVVALMKNENLFASQGGPIILAQIENEYGNINAAYGNAATSYIQWAANLAESLDTGVPWIMCQQPDAPGDIINTCNGFYCDSFQPNSPSKPKMWTENWAGWYQNWGLPRPSRPVEDVAFAVARFFAKGGSFQNYYMYHGGTNFGRTAGEWITTTYDYDAPLDEYGRPRLPKWAHLKELHAAIKSCEPALANVDGQPIHMSLGGPLEVHIYANGQGPTIGDVISRSTTCAAFVSNQDSDGRDTTVFFNGQSYALPAWSVSILPDCKTVTFNTAQVGTQTIVKKMVRTISANTSTVKPSSESSTPGPLWQTYQEPALDSWGSPFTHSGALLEQIGLTKDVSDYLWYTASVEVPAASPATVTINGIKDTLHIFLNGVHAGSPTKSFQPNYSLPVQLRQGSNNISVLSSTLGLQNYGAWLERERAGIEQAHVSSTSLGGNGSTYQLWQYQVGMQGEGLRLYSETGAENATWQSGTPPTNQALMWYKTTVHAPAGTDPVALDLASMGKGEAWINGKSVGRFWTIPQTLLENFPGGTCSTSCDYRGKYNPSHCTGGCEEPSQRWYHVPRDWLQPTNNLLVIFEEIGGDVSKVALGTQVFDRVCGHMSERHPTARVSSGENNADDNAMKLKPPQLLLDCSPGYQISEVVFGSFGNPSGNCGSFQKGSCHAPLSAELVNLECVGRQSCTLRVSWANFAVGNPCPEITKGLAVEALCSPARNDTSQLLQNPGRALP